MSNGSLYPYAEGPLLEQPNSYFYTPYHGHEFLHAWQESRTIYPRPEVLSRPSADIERRSSVGDKVDTVNLLHDLLSHHADQTYWWPRLVKKFEVKKRLFAAYQSEAPHRPCIESGYQNLDIYLLFAEWLSLSYQQQGKLQLINTMLKVMDTLLSQQASLSMRQRANLCWLLNQEKICVSHLQQTVMK
ncbi:MAG: hypothetical protein Kow0083_00710 [Methylophaga sp.]|jgi:hypothetical protein